MPTYSSIETIQSVEQLEDCLSEPTPQVIEVLSRLDGDLLVLGASGKMGPTLARMARRAFDAAGHKRRVIAVSRFSNAGSRAAFEAHGVETIACDLLDARELARLPECPQIMFMAGMKFGSTGQQALTWATNCYLPALVCERFRKSRIAAFSTGNVYGLVPVDSGGSRETDAPQPVGEYAMSCLGRERMFEYFSSAYQIPTVLLRLNYSCELRYGVIVDLAEKIWHGEPIDLAMGHVNVIWQTDANAMALAAFAQASVPAGIVNLSGSEMLEVRQVCEKIGKRLDRPVRFTGQPARDALLSNSQLNQRLFGSSRRTADEVIGAVAHWVRRGGERLGKPTKFQSRDGAF